MCVYARALYAQRNRLQIYNKFLKCASARAFFLPFLLLGLRRVCSFRRILFTCLGCLPAVLFCLLVGDVIPARLHPAVYFSPLYRRAFVHLPRFYPAPAFFLPFLLLGLRRVCSFRRNFIRLFGLFTCGAISILFISRGCYPRLFTPCCLLLAATSASLRSFAEILSGVCIFLRFFHLLLF